MGHIIKLGRLMGFEPTRAGATILCLNHLTTAAMFSGAKDGIRTRDPRLGKAMLYQLSHFRVRTDIRFQLSVVSCQKIDPQTKKWNQ